MVRLLRLLIGVSTVLAAALALGGVAAASPEEAERAPSQLAGAAQRDVAPSELEAPGAVARPSAAKRKPCKKGSKGRKCGRKRSAHDFTLAVIGPQKPRQGKRVWLKLRVKNQRKWTATSVRACARVDPRAARIVAAPRLGAVRFEGKSVCWILRRLKPRRVVALEFAVKRKGRAGKRRGLRVAARVSAGNSNTVSQRLKPPVAVRKKRPARKRGAKAGASLSPCVTPLKLGVVFVTDDSESMGVSDPTHLRARAISVGLDQLPDGSLAAATTFSSFSSSLFGVSSVDPITRPALKLAAEELFDSGLTDYDEAFRGAREQLDALVGADRKAVIFLSDGAPNSTSFTADGPIAAAGIPIYTIGLGVPALSEAESVLTRIAAGSGAHFFRADSAGQMQSIFARIIAALTCGTQSVTETFSLAPGASKVIPFTVEPRDAEFRALASWSNGEVTVSALRPNQSPLTPVSLLPGEAFVNARTYALLSAANPMIGGWQLVVSASKGNVSQVDVTIDVFERYLPDPPPPPAPTGRRLDPCVASYPKTRTTTTKQFGGEKTVYDRAASLYQVCAGFGAPEELDLTPEMKCALIAAAATWGGPPATTWTNAACDTAAMVGAFQSGDWLGYAAGKACGYFGEVFAGAAGIVAAGASSPTGPGAAAVGLFTYRAMSSFLKVACGGLLDGGAAALGVKLEADHQRNIALDVTKNGKCIAYGKRFGLVHWSAVDCP